VHLDSPNPIKVEVVTHPAAAGKVLAAPSAPGTVPAASMATTKSQRYLRAGRLGDCGKGVMS